MSLAEEQKRKIKEIVADEQEVGEKIDQIAKIRGWFRPEDDSVFYPVVLQHTEGNLDVEETCSRLFTPIDEKISAQKLDDVNFMDLWYSVIHAARRSPFYPDDIGGDVHALHQADVTSLVAAFKNHKIPGNEQYNYIYSSLTNFPMACREVHNEQPCATASELEIDVWKNLNSFLSQVTHKGLHDLSIFAIWTIREALERDHQDDEEGTAAQKYNVLVPAAAAWVFGMGKSLARKRQDLTPTDRKQGNPGKGGELWKGKAEFSKERWVFWKERFAAIANMEEVSRKTSNLAKDAIEAMERAETFEDVRHSANLGPE